MLREAQKCCNFFARVELLQLLLCVLFVWRQKTIHRQTGPVASDSLPGMLQKEPFPPATRRYSRPWIRALSSFP